jgi:hypothetical protein
LLIATYRAGDGFESHDTDVHPGDQALGCVACPQPGINFDWAEVPEDERYIFIIIILVRVNVWPCSDWFRAFVSCDRYFRSVPKAKKFEAGDICLSDGKAYFPPKASYKEWTEVQTELQRTVRIISNLW